MAMLKQEPKQHSDRQQIVPSSFVVRSAPQGKMYQTLKTFIVTRRLNNCKVYRARLVSPRPPKNEFCNI